MLVVCSVVSCMTERVAKYEEPRKGLAPKQALPINGQKIRLGSQKIKTSTPLSLSVDLCWQARVLLGMFGHGFNEIGVVTEVDGGGWGRLISVNTRQQFGR